MVTEGDLVKKLKRENRKLKELLELKQSEVEALTQRNSELMDNCKVMEFTVKRLLEEVYMGRVKIDFDKYTLCVDTKCVQFWTYSELLIALMAAKLFLSP
jgi:predicted nuclease with TOPRIM domain